MVEVSVIIVNYNKPSLTRTCVRSIYEKTEGVTFEIILVDNGSSEGQLADIRKDFPDVRYVHNAENLGFSKGNNCGIALANGDYILLLNNDTVLANNAIYEAAHFLREHPRVGIVTCELVYPDGRKQHCCQRFPSVRYRLAELLRLQKLIGRKKGGRLLLGSFFSHDEIAYPDWVWGTFFMFPGRLLQNFPDHRLHETFFMYWEDVQWCWEIGKLGYKVAFTPAGKVIHLMNGSEGPKPLLMAENKELFLKTYYPVWKRALIRCIDKLLQL